MISPDPKSCGSSSTRVIQVHSMGTWFRVSSASCSASWALASWEFSRKSTRIQPTTNSDLISKKWASISEDCVVNKIVNYQQINGIESSIVHKKWSLIINSSQKKMSFSPNAGCNEEKFGIFLYNTHVKDKLIRNYHNPKWMGLNECIIFTAILMWCSSQ